MKQRFRLKKSTDFQRVRRLGKSYAHPLVVLIASPNQLSHTRFGIVTGRRIGNAVHRNRVKRRIRSALIPLLGQLVSGWDVVLIARKPIDTANYSQIQMAMLNLLRRAQLLNLSNDY